MQHYQDRQQLINKLFPEGIPSLWCALLTHYDKQGAIDEERIKAHLNHLSSYIKGYLIAGSTGDGWELNDEEILQLLSIVEKEAKVSNLNLLIGILKTNTVEMQNFIQKNKEMLITLPIKGITVCAPKGKELSQHDIAESLSYILQLDIPTALYQLPQITQNEIAPETAANLAECFKNFILFKDTSGADRVAMTKLNENFKNIFMLRGAEGNYTKWLKANGGPYDGFLLGSANCFPKELTEIIKNIEAHHDEKATELSLRLTSLLSKISQLVAKLFNGNPFTNANKAMDHFFAYGPNAEKTSPPRLHSGAYLPIEMIKATKELLTYYDLLPRKGYYE